MIEVCRVNHWFGDRAALPERDRPVLREINLQLSEPRIGIIGSNGSGKSTFARLLNGLLIPTEGQVFVDGLNTRDRPKAVRRKVGFVFQNPDNQIVFPIVEEDIAFGLKNLKLKPAEIARRVDQVLDRYQLSAFRHHSTHQLSGGQKQLLAISSVLVMQPQYIVFDEPTTLLDLRNRLRIQQALAQLPQPIIVVTHDLDLIANFDRVIVFEQGKIIFDDVPSIAIPGYIEQMSL